MGERVSREVESCNLPEGGWRLRQREFCRWCIWLCQGGGPVVIFGFDGRAVGTLGSLWSSSAGKVHYEGGAQAVVLLCNYC